MEAARPAIEHGTTRSGRWLRSRRLRLALWVAVAEALLFVLGVVPRWPAVVVAACLVLFHPLVGRRLRPDALREVSWIAAVSQLLVLLLPALVLVLGAALLAALVLAAVIAVVLVLAHRR